jgi:hypothetical protein
MKPETFTEKEVALVNDILYTAGWPLLAQKTVRACEKQTPKGLNMFHCQCGMVIDDEWDFCTKCGQAIKRVTP